jgi:DNA polymerase III epsilon subunit family exonuclease
VVSPAPSLLARAAQALEDGPLHTLELAQAVLDLRGHPQAASKAVFALLGRDRRFAVDAAGHWSLATDRPVEAVPLSRLPFAVVDVETTGGVRGPTEDRLTEVAIIHVEDGIVGASYQTLVNPGCPIPPRIQGFTGITDRMVAGAPYFEAVADEVRTKLDGRTFVAHNVSFDWGKIRAGLVAAGMEMPSVRRLCTVRMGRYLHPRLRSQGLDSLTAHYGIRVQSRHRAFGDAFATARLLLALLREAESRGIADLDTLLEELRPRRRAAAGRSGNRSGPGRGASGRRRGAGGGNGGGEGS